jgi:hypothetical protein
MSASPEISNNHDEVRTSLDSIIAISERWLSFLARRQKRVRLAQAFLTAVSVCVGSIAIVLAIVLEQDSLTFFLAHPGTTGIIAVSILSVGGACGAVAYVLLGRKENPKLRELSDLIARTKARRGAGGEGEEVIYAQEITGSALLETEKILELLPQLVRTRNQDSLLFGMVAFVVAAVLARPPIGILVGVIVWLYFRYETNRTYDRQISKIEEQKKIFEQRKEEFLENL